VERIQQLQSLLGWSLEDIRQVLVLEDQVATLRQQYYDAESIHDRQHVLQKAIDLTAEQLTRVKQRMTGLMNLQCDLEGKLVRYQTLRDNVESSSNMKDGADE
jgi:DNA-binding transcriptional MerR regulator